MEHVIGTTGTKLQEIIVCLRSFLTFRVDLPGILRSERKDSAGHLRAC